MQNGLSNERITPCGELAKFSNSIHKHHSYDHQCDEAASNAGYLLLILYTEARDRLSEEIYAVHNGPHPPLSSFKRVIFRVRYNFFVIFLHFKLLLTKIKFN